MIFFDVVVEGIFDAFILVVQSRSVLKIFLSLDGAVVPSPVAAVEAAIDNYYNPLINGLVDDVDASIDAMNAAMDSAGIQDIL